MSILVLVLLSASVKRFSDFRTLDFFYRLYLRREEICEGQIFKLHYLLVHYVVGSTCIHETYVCLVLLLKKLLLNILTVLTHKIRTDY